MNLIKKSWDYSTVCVFNVCCCSYLAIKLHNYLATELYVANWISHHEARLVSASFAQSTSEVLS